MRLQESGEMYLETILVLSKQKGMVHAIDVGRELGYTRPSVSRAMGILKKAGYITIGETGNIVLTASGKAIAERIYERHVVLTSLLKHFGVEDKTAAEDACKMEHDISDTSLKAMKKYLKENNILS